jgi:pilus assembly protein Flp/PilA
LVRIENRYWRLNLHRTDLVQVPGFHNQRLKVSIGMSKMKQLTGRLMCEENGAALIEYSILIGLIAAAVVTTIAAIAVWITGRWDALKTAIGA